MVLTINYSDLQDIKAKLIQEKILDEERIYILINSYKETLNYMYKNSLVHNKSKIDYEDELNEFAIELLKNTQKTYKELEDKYMVKNISNKITNSKDIKLLI